MLKLNKLKTKTTKAPSEGLETPAAAAFVLSMSVWVNYYHTSYRLMLQPSVQHPLTTPELIAVKLLRN